MAAEAPVEITRSPATAGAIGLMAGIFSALLGVGGGLLMVPAMVYMLRIRQHRAHGTSLAVIPPTAVLGVIQYAQARHIDWSVAILLAIGGVFGAMVGARLANAIKAPALKRAFGVFVVITGMVMIARPGGYGAGAGHAIVNQGASFVIVFVGLIAGIVSGLLGVGGGIIMVPAVVYLLGLDQHTAQGISLAVIVPVAISGALIHYRKGNVITTLVLPLAIGAAIGAYVTAHYVNRIPSDNLRMLFGIFLVIVGVSMVGKKAARKA